MELYRDPETILILLGVLGILFFAGVGVLFLSV